MATSDAQKRAQRKYRETHREELNAYQRKYRAEHPEQVRRWKRDAARRKLYAEVKAMQDAVDRITKLAKAVYGNSAEGGGKE